jgi:cysteine desulfurase
MASYLDHAATTPLDPEVLEAMMPYLRDVYGNPSSVHALGRQARHAVDESRATLAGLLGAEPAEIVFTSGATEANNLAIKGLVRRPGDALLTSLVEHEAVLTPARSLEAAGHRVRYLSPGAGGTVSIEALRNALPEGFTLASFLHVNNETGALNPVAEFADACRAHGVALHVDAVQSAGLFAPRVDDLGADLLSLSAHKFYGPKGIGCLYVRSGIELAGLVEGGSQERRRRGGTEHVAGIVGMAAAMSRAYASHAKRKAQLAGLRKRLLVGLRSALGDTFVVNTPFEASSPHILNIAFPPQAGRPVDGEMLLLNLDLEGVYVSSGSACTSGAVEPSHVLLALGLPKETASAAIRFSLGASTTEADVDAAVRSLTRVLERMLRSLPGAVGAR